MEARCSLYDSVYARVGGRQASFENFCSSNELFTFAAKTCGACLLLGLGSSTHIQLRCPDCMVEGLLASRSRRKRFGSLVAHLRQSHVSSLRSVWVCGVWCRRHT